MATTITTTLPIPARNNIAAPNNDNKSHNIITYNSTL
jgi:hypothetical protein